MVDGSGLGSVLAWKPEIPNVLSWIMERTYLLRPNNSSLMQAFQETSATLLTEALKAKSMVRQGLEPNKLARPRGQTFWIEGQLLEFGAGA